MEMSLIKKVNVSTYASSRTELPIS